MSFECHAVAKYYKRRTLASNNSWYGSLSSSELKASASHLSFDNLSELYIDVTALKNITNLETHFKRNFGGGCQNSAMPFSYHGDSQWAK